MIYNRSAVKHRRPINSKSEYAKEVSSSFKFGQSDEDKLRSIVIKGNNDLETVLRVCSAFHHFIEHDAIHRYQGIRTPSQVLKHEKGHCIEQNALLYIVLKAYGINPSFTLIKNAKGYDNNLDEHGTHPMVRFKHQNEKYLADMIMGGVVKDNDKFKYVARQDMTISEFFSFYLLDAGIDLILHNKPERALNCCIGALDIDPNNYPAYFTMAESYGQLGNFTMAENIARKGIRIAPDITDTYAETADLFYRMEKPRKKVMEMFEEALKRETKDIQVLFFMEKTLRKMDEDHLAKAVREKMIRFPSVFHSEWVYKSGDWLYA